MYGCLLPKPALRVSGFVAGLVLSFGCHTGIANAANLITNNSYKADLVPSADFRISPSSSSTSLFGCLVRKPSELSPPRCKFTNISFIRSTNLILPQYLSQYIPLPPLVDPGSRYSPQYVPQSLPPLGSPSNGPSNHGSYRCSRQCLECFNYKGDSNFQKAFCAGYVPGGACDDCR